MGESPVPRDYVDWLVQESMLARGGAVASQVAGSSGMSQRPFARRQTSSSSAFCIVAQGPVSPFRSDRRAFDCMIASRSPTRM